MPDPSEVTCLSIPGNEDTFLSVRNVTGDVGLKHLPNKGKITCVLDALIQRTEAMGEATRLLIPDCTIWGTVIVVEGLINPHEDFPLWINWVWAEELGGQLDDAAVLTTYLS